MANDLTLQVKMQEDASKGFQKLSNELKKFGGATKQQSEAIARHTKQANQAYKELDEEIEKVDKELKGLNTTQEDLTKSFVKGGVAVEIFKRALQSAKQFLNESVQETLEYRNALSATTATVRAFGLEEQNLMPAIQRLTEDGLLTQADAYRTLSQLLAGGLNIQEAIDLTEAYKNVAAFGRDTTLSFSEAVKNNAEAFLTESSILGNRSGLQENFNQLIQLGADEMGKSVKALTANVEL